MSQRVHTRSSSGRSCKGIVLSPAKNSEPAMGQEEAMLVGLYVFCVERDIVGGFIGCCRFGYKNERKINENVE